MKWQLCCSILFFSVALLFPQNAYAYLDPGTGSFMLQLIIGLLLGVLFSVKLFFNKIKAFLKSLFSRRKKYD